MRTSILSLALATALGGLPAAAQSYGDVARVLSATPISERVPAPRRECRVEQVTTYQERRTVRPGPYDYGPEPSGAGTVLGAIVGGVIGHQIDRGGGTAAGAIVGSLIGNSIERDAHAGYEPGGREVLVERTPVPREVERCRWVEESREQVVAYDVRYEYNGREFRTRMPYDPGPEMPVNVEVRPPSARAPLAGPAAPHYR